MKHHLLTLFTMAAIVAACQAESYALKLNRPEKIGNKAEISVKFLQKIALAWEIAINNRLIKGPVNFEAGSLEAVREILVVNDKGHATKVKLTVKSLKFTNHPFHRFPSPSCFPPCTPTQPQFPSNNSNP